MSEEPEFIRPDLTGETLGGVVLGQRIGGGGFGDVYISPDHKICVKVIFREEFSSLESYEKELDAVRCISTTLRQHCGIPKFLGSGRTDPGFNYFEPFHPCGGIRSIDSEAYEKFPVIPDSMEEDCHELKEEKSQEIFYYFMLAADNLEKKRGYCPDTLANRRDYGILKRMSEDEKIQVIAEIIDSLLFLYRLEVRDELNRPGRYRREHPAGQIFHIAHGDIKPENIFFVNGHAQLGDMGATLQIDPKMPPQIGTRMFLPTEFQRHKLLEKCGDDYFACSVFYDLIALSKTVEYLVLNGDEKTIPPDPSFELTRLANKLYTFWGNGAIRPENVVDELARFRREEFPFGNLFRQLSHYGKTAPDIRVQDLCEFNFMWQIVDAESRTRFRVTNGATRWREYRDILLAERYHPEAEAEIREKESDLLARGESEGLPLLIYHLKKTREIIVLSHSKAEFEPSEEALRRLRDEIG